MAAAQDAAYRALAENAVPDGESGILFARFRFDQAGNANFGFSDLAVPAAYNDFEAQINRRNSTVLTARDGTGFQDFDPIVDGVDVRYKRWLVADNELHPTNPDRQAPGDAGAEKQFRPVMKGMHCPDGTDCADALP